MKEKIPFSDVQVYLSKNFLTSEQLIEKAQLKVQHLDDLRESECIPGPSYTLTPSTTFSIKTSISGEKDLGKIENYQENQIHYYHPSVLNWIKKALEEQLSASLPEVAIKVRAEFTLEFAEGLREFGGTYFGFSEYFYSHSADEVNTKAISELACQNWNQLLKGSFGICTRWPGSARDIARKLVAVARVKWFLENEEQIHFNKHEVIKVLHEFDDAVSDFSPHERDKCPRVLYYEKLKEKNSIKCC